MRQRQVLSDLPCLYTYVIQAKPLVVSGGNLSYHLKFGLPLSINAQLTLQP
nr:MAG TPA: hypothetical protein [Microviridae sp.]